MAGRGFNTSLTEGQLNLPGGVQCRTPWGNIGSGPLGALASLTHDREIAYTSLFARLVLKGRLQLSRQQIRTAERAIVRYRFGGSGPAYRQALAQAGANREMARSIIGDELRQAKIERGFRGSSPSGQEIADYQATYSETPARLVRVTPAPTWLGSVRRGVAIEGMAPEAVFGIPTGRGVTLHTREGVLHVRAVGPTAPLGAFTIDAARSSIRAALVHLAKDQAFDNWLVQQESSALAWTTCRRDWLPAVGPLELTTELPFLELAL